VGGIVDLEEAVGLCLGRTCRAESDQEQKERKKPSSHGRTLKVGRLSVRTGDLFVDVERKIPRIEKVVKRCWYAVSSAEAVDITYTRIRPSYECIASPIHPSQSFPW